MNRPAILLGVVAACVVLVCSGAVFVLVIAQSGPVAPPTAGLQLVFGCGSSDAAAHDAPLIAERLVELGLWAGVEVSGPRAITIRVGGADEGVISWVRQSLRPGRLEFLEVEDDSHRFAVDAAMLPGVPAGDPPLASSAAALAPLASRVEPPLRFGVTCTGEPPDLACEPLALIVPAAHVTEADVVEAMTDDESGAPYVRLTFSADGTRRLAELTRALVGRRLAIVVDGEVRTAPRVMEPIVGGSAIIHAGYASDVASAQREAEALAASLRRPPLSCTSWELLHQDVFGTQ